MRAPPRRRTAGYKAAHDSSGAAIFARISPARPTGVTLCRAVMLDATKLGSGVLLFGSVARGDAGPDSDIDLLVIESASRIRKDDSWTIPGTSISIHKYSTSALRKLFQRGTLFALHLRHEARIVADPDGELQRLLRAPVPFDAHNELARVARERAVLYATDFEETTSKGYRVARHLLRTAAFAKCASLGEVTFSARRAAQILASPRIEPLLSRPTAGGRFDLDAVRESLDACLGRAAFGREPIACMVRRDLRFAGYLAGNRQAFSYTPSDDDDNEEVNPSPRAA